MPSKVIIIVIEFMLLGINMFWALLRAHFSPSRAQNIFMSPNINSIVLCWHALVHMRDCQSIFFYLKKDSIYSCIVNLFAKLGNILCTENVKDRLAIVNLSLKMTYCLHF